METQTAHEDLKTLSECISSLKKQGFDKDFQIVEKGMKTIDEERVYIPEEVKILNFYRFEGETDPADMSILYAIETNTGLRGTLVDAFGTYANTEITDFISQVEDINKKTDVTSDNSGSESHVSIGKF